MKVIEREMKRQGNRQLIGIKKSSEEERNTKLKVKKPNTEQESERVQL